MTRLSKSQNGASSQNDAAAGDGNVHGSEAYKAAGIDYSVLDAGKRLALDHALLTSPLLERRGARALDASRGESAFLFEIAGATLAFVLETLGTKSIIARQVLDELDSDHFEDVAYDTVAAAVNDVCSVGALPLVVNAYFATGSSEWYDQPKRAESLLQGWRAACGHAGCAWGGGESPTLPDLVNPNEIELAASVVGMVPVGHPPVLGEQLGAGDEIVLAMSSGLHANGASLARSVADRLDNRYATSLPSGDAFGDALLAATTIYAPLVEQLQKRRLPVTYMSHISGHGFLKLMRSPKTLTYRIRDLPPVPEVLDFLVKQTGMDSRTAYSTLNMGAGLAIYCQSGGSSAVVEAASSVGVDAIVAGVVETGPRRVIVEPLDVLYKGEELQLAPTRTSAA
jgi:phosphoribosylformylglycinamidine cyclo-ligase